MEQRAVWHRWGELAAIAGRLDAELDAAGLGGGSRVGLVLRNRVPDYAALAGLLATRRCTVVLDPNRPVDDLGALALAAVVDGDSLDVRLTGAPAKAPGVAIELLTSGTTGPPSRVALTYAMFGRALGDTGHYGTANRDTEAARLRPGVRIIAGPLAHLSGFWGTLDALTQGRPVVLLERFVADDWVDAVRRHRPKVASLVPAALRMVFDAGPPRDALSSLSVLLSGTAPLPPQLAAAFENRYGVPVLPVYGATEFAGAVAGWTLDDHRRWAAEKRGSVGRAHPGCELRIVDGLLEVRSAQLGEDVSWVRTNDLARIDEDGFLWIEGRADGVIVRGGFKVSPQRVAGVLEAHPAVREAAVAGRSDERLGEVPVAAVELVAGAALLDVKELEEFARQQLAPYEVPTRIVVVDALPRTPSLKVSLPAVRQLCAETE